MSTTNKVAPISELAGRRQILEVLFFVLSLSASFDSAFGYDNLTQYASSRATNLNAHLQADYYMSNLDDIEDWFVDLQAFWLMMPPPGTDPWTQSSSPTHIPIDWSSLGSTFTSQLVPDTQYGVNVYPLTIKEDFTTHQVEYWVESSCIHTMAFRTGYDWTMYTPGGGDTNMYNPSRVIISATLVKDNEMYTYLYNEGFEVGASLATADEDCEFLEDSDGDGWSNREEIMYGTDPYDPGDLPAITRVYDTGSGVELEWAAPSNRWYQVQSMTNLMSDTFDDEGSLRMGSGTTLTHTNTSSDEVKFWRYQVQEADVNGNGLPDWWEYKYWGALTTNSPTGDEVDNDGLDNSEEIYFGYSPLVSERDVIHSAYHTVVVASDTPNPDSDDERFDFHGGGRVLGLASGGSDGFGIIQGDSHSGGIFFNNDEDNLYIGISGLNRDGINAFVMFIDATDGGVSNLAHLSNQPYAFGQADNFAFDTNSFLPEVGIILGGNYADGKNFPSYEIGPSGSEVDFGQGVYNLIDLSSFSGFSSTTGAISQWAKHSGGAETSPNAGCEIRLSLTALGAQPGDTIRVAACFIGGTDGTNRWASGEAYGKTFSGGGYGSTTFAGADVQLADAGQTLPNVAYAGFDENDVMLQAFFWNAGSPGEDPALEGNHEWYDNLSTQIVDIATSGFTRIYLPPPQKGESGLYSMGYDPYDHYDVGSYQQKTPAGVTDTRFGNLSELTNLVSIIQANGVVPIVDIVMNHMRQATGGKTFNYVHDIFEKAATDFHASTEGHNDELLPYHKTTEFGSDYYDVDQLALHMRLGLKRWGDWLTDTVGYQAYRFDLTQRIEPWYIWEWMHYGAMRGSFGVVEYWALADGRELQEWVDLTGHSVAVFDWNLQKMLKDMCESNGSFDMKTLDHPSLLGLEPNYTVTFVDSHDTYSPMKALDELGILQDKDLAYAYILFQVGLPMVYYHDYYLQPYHDGTADDPPDDERGVPSGYYGTPLKPEIDKGMWIRQSFLSGSPVYLVTNTMDQSDLFIAARDGGESKVGGMLAINDATSAKSTTVVTPWLSTTLRDAYSNDSGTEVTTAADGSVSVTIPARSYYLYVPASALP